MFELRLPAFHGPLALLLRLVEEAQLDITAISLVQVADQYLAHLRHLQAIDLDELAEFIVIGAKLLYLKSCALLPKPSSPAQRQAQEAVARELTEMVEEYRRFQEAAQALRRLEEAGRRAYPRPDQPSIALPPGLQGVTLETLVEIFQEAMERKPPAPPATETLLPQETITVQEKTVAIEADLRRRRRLSFRALMMACRSRAEVVAAFLAVLELIKAGRVWAQQGETFGDISLVAATVAHEPPAAGEGSARSQPP